jgi:hypothetical protein
VLTRRGGSILEMRIAGRTQAMSDIALSIVEAIRCALRSVGVTA